MKNRKTLGVFVVATFALLAIGSVAAFGFRNSGMFSLGNNPEDNQEFMNSIQTAIENKDYNSWKALMESQITEENFAQIQERHEQMSELQNLREQFRTAIQEGDTETAEEIRAQIQELMPEKTGSENFEKGFGRGHGPGKMHEGQCPFVGSE